VAASDVRYRNRQLLARYTIAGIEDLYTFMLFAETIAGDGKREGKKTPPP
jgi:hypothetical protein